MKNHCSYAMQGLRKNQLSHKHQQDTDSEIGIEEVLQARQEKDLSCIERKIEIITLFHLIFLVFLYLSHVSYQTFQTWKKKFNCIQSSSFRTHQTGKIRI